TLQTPHGLALSGIVAHKGPQLLQVAGKKRHRGLIRLEILLAARDRVPPLSRLGVLEEGQPDLCLLADPQWLADVARGVRGRRGGGWSRRGARRRPGTTPTPRARSARRRARIRAGRSASPSAFACDLRGREPTGECAAVQREPTAQCAPTGREPIARRAAVQR